MQQFERFHERTQCVATSDAQSLEKCIVQFIGASQRSGVRQRSSLGLLRASGFDERKRLPFCPGVIHRFNEFRHIKNTFQVESDGGNALVLCAVADQILGGEPLLIAHGEDITDRK